MKKRCPGGIQLGEYHWLTGSMDLSDATIVAACQQGDPCAQRQLFDDTQAEIYRLMVRMVGQQDAADLTQQAYLQVFRKINQFAGASRLSTWIYRVAVNEALQYLRRKKRTATQTLDQEPVDYRVGRENASEVAELLETALAGLDPALRAIFLLREKEELSYHEIAETLNIPAGTVGSRLNRARHELQERLTQAGWSR